MNRFGWILLLAACAKSPRVEERVEWVRILENPFEQSQFTGEDYRYWFTRIVDAQTGEPIEGATLFGVDEHDFSVKALPVVDRSARSDAFGLVRFEVDRAHDEWAYVVAPGYAPYAEHRAPPFPIELVRGVDVTVRLLDPLGRPVAGGAVQYFLGCGHTPNSREATTDADGFAVVRCVDPDEGYLFVLGPRIGADEVELCDIAARGEVRTIIGRAGGIVEGRVLEEDGAPVAGAFVGATCFNHGPWTRTGSDGRFSLMSVERYDDLAVYRNFGDKQPVARCDAPPEGVPLLIRLGAKVRTHKVELHVVNADDPDEPTYQTKVLAWRESDGSTISTSVTRSGWTWLDLPDGRWNLRIGGTLGPFRAEERTIDAANAAKEAIEIAMRLRPAVRLELPKPALDWMVVIASATEERYLSGEERENDCLRVPRDRELALRLIDVEVGRSDSSGPFVWLPPGDLPEQGVRLRAPEESARDSMTVPAGIVRVLDSAGRPLAGAWVESSSPSWVSMSETDERGECRAGSDGARLAVRAPGDDGEWAVQCRRLDGEGPWTVRFGTASVRLEVRDEQGRPLAWRGIRADGETVEEAEPDHELPGFHGGVHTILVAADGHKAWMQRFRLRPGERRVLRVVLPRAR